MAPHDPQILIKAFADPTRLLILRQLLGGPKCVSDLEALVSARQTAISHHLGLLRLARLVDSARDGQLSLYYLAKPKLVERMLDLIAEEEPVLHRSPDEIRAEYQLQGPHSSIAARRRRKAAEP